MYDEIKNKEEVEQTKKALEERGINVVIKNTKEEALNYLKETIPEKSSVMNGSSTTLGEIGFTDYLKNQSKWNNLHEDILNEEDQEKQNDLRRQSQAADYFLGSVNAISKEGELVAVDASGTRVGAYPFAAKNLILVSGTNKITENLDDAFKRTRQHAFPLEDKRALEAYGFNSTFGKWVIIEREIFPGRTTLVLVNEKLGY